MNVYRAIFSSGSPCFRDSTGFAAPAFPRVTDAPKPRRRQISVRLLETYGAQRESVKHRPGSVAA